MESKVNYRSFPDGAIEDSSEKSPAAPDPIGHASVTRRGANPRAGRQDNGRGGQPALGQEDPHPGRERCRGPVRTADRATVYTPAAMRPIARGASARSTATAHGLPGVAPSRGRRTSELLGDVHKTIKVTLRLPRGTLPLCHDMRAWMPQGPCSTSSFVGSNVKRSSEMMTTGPRFCGGWSGSSQNRRPRAMPGRSCRTMHIFCSKPGGCHLRR